MFQIIFNLVANHCSITLLMENAKLAQTVLMWHACGSYVDYAKLMGVLIYLNNNYYYST